MSRAPATGAETRSTFERVYSVIVLLKGIDGLGELLLGIALLVVPQSVADVLAMIAAELAEGTSTVRLALANSVSGAGAGVEAGATAFALFLIVHGVVKVSTAFALLRRAVRLYPFALGALSILLVVQWFDAVTAPTLGAWVLAGLDVLVVALVGWEYHRLLGERMRTSARPS